VTLSTIDLCAFISANPPSIENGSLSEPLNTEIIPDSAIKSDSLSSASAYLKYTE